jgi:hypothetical protein
MSGEIVFPEPEPEVLIETNLVREIINSTIANTVSGGSCLWYGNTGIGKTTIARMLVEKVAASYDSDPSNPNAFLAKHFHVGDVTKWSGSEQKQGISCLYGGTLGAIDQGEYRMLPTNLLAENTFYSLMRTRTKMVLIDEAGCLSLEAIRGIMLVRDISEAKGWTIIFVFIGMDDLPKKLNRLPQIRRRIHHWRYFDEYTFDDTWQFLTDLHPHFAKLNKGDKEHYAQVKFIHETLGGYPGLIVPFIHQMDYLLKAQPGEVTEKFLRTVHYLMATGKDKALVGVDRFSKASPSKKPRGKGQK